MLRGVTTTSARIECAGTQPDGYTRYTLTNAGGLTLTITPAWAINIAAAVSVRVDLMLGQAGNGGPATLEDARRAAHEELDSRLGQHVPVYGGLFEIAA